MHRVVACVIAVAACGRIHFEPRPRDGNAASGDSGLVVDDSGFATGCGFIPCDAGSTACCIGDQTACVPDGTCGGGTYACGPCPKLSSCCDLGDAGSLCNTICPARQ